MVRIFAALAGLIHVLFFVMESLLWMNPKVHGRFKVDSLEIAEKMRVFLLNQGFYNLFLAAAVFIGLGLLGSKRWAVVGRTLVVYGCASMVAAAVVLLFSADGMWRGALIQGAPPLLALIGVLRTRPQG